MRSPTGTPRLSRWVPVKDSVSLGGGGAWSGEATPPRDTESSQYPPPDRRSEGRPAASGSGKKQGEDVVDLLPTDTHQEGAVATVGLGAQDKEVGLGVHQCFRPMAGLIEAVRTGLRQ